MDETWLPAVGYEGQYEVSDCGRVRSLDRVVTRRTSPQFWRGRVLSGTPNKHTGYVSIRMSNRNRKVHTVVLEAFVGPAPERMECLHNNGNKSDNRLANISWGTRSTNIKDQVRHGVHVSARRTRCPRGHFLSGPNIKPVERCRSCLACARARGMARHELRQGRLIDLQSLADAHYGRIMRTSYVSLCGLPDLAESMR